MADALPTDSVDHIAAETHTSSMSTQIGRPLPIVNLDLDNVAVREPELISESDRCGYLDDGMGVVANAGLVLIGSDDEGGHAEESATNEVHAHAPAEVGGFYAQAVGWQSVLLIEHNVQAAGEEANSRALRVDVGVLDHPLGQVTGTTAYQPSQSPHPPRVADGNERSNRFPDPCARGRR